MAHSNKEKSIAKSNNTQTDKTKEDLDGGLALFPVVWAVLREIGRPDTANEVYECVNEVVGSSSFYDRMDVKSNDTLPTLPLTRGGEADRKN